MSDGAPDTGRAIAVSNAPEPSLALPGWLVGGVGYTPTDASGSGVQLPGFESTAACLGRKLDAAVAGGDGGRLEK